MIDHVVIAAEGAFPVIAVPQLRLHSFIGGRIVAQNVEYPIAPTFRLAHFLVRSEVKTFCVIGAFSLYRTIFHTPFRASVGRILRDEILQSPPRRNADGRLFEQPLYDIEIVTAFLQNHRAGFVGIPPIAADKTVRVMPIGNVFRLFYSAHLSQSALGQNLFYRPKKRRIAQHMADGHQPFSLFRGALQFHALVRPR